MQPTHLVTCSPAGLRLSQSLPDHVLIIYILLCYISDIFASLLGNGIPSRLGHKQGTLQGYHTWAIRDKSVAICLGKVGHMDLHVEHVIQAPHARCSPESLGIMAVD